MNRLIDKFRKAAQSSVQPMGFRTARAAAPEPGMLLIVSGAPEEINKYLSDIKTVSGVLVSPNVTAATGVKKIVTALADIPVGLYADDTGAEGMASLAETGWDFIVFPASSHISAPSADNKQSRILQVESAMNDSLLLAANSLPVDAFLVDYTFEGGSLVWHELMILQHLANMLAKPLIIRIPPDVTETELKALWEAGADGVLVEAAVLRDGGLKKIQELIGKLPPRQAKRRDKVDITLPSTGAFPEQSPDEENEEE